MRRPIPHHSLSQIEVDLIGSKLSRTMRVDYELFAQHGIGSKETAICPVRYHYQPAFRLFF